MDFEKLLSLLLFLSSTLSWAATFQKFTCLSSIQKELFATNLTIEQFATQLGFTVEYENGGDILRLVDKKGEEMAYIEVRHEGKYHARAPNFVFIKFMRVDDSIKDNKVSLSLLKYAIDRYPSNEGVYGVMAGANKTAIERGLAAGQSLNQSLKDTHFYRSLIKLGYGDVAEDSNEATLYLRRTVDLLHIPKELPPKQMDLELPSE